MIEFLAILFSSIAGLWDLKTTEVPDDIPYLMTVIGLSYWFVTGVATGNLQPFLSSLFIGSAVLFVGLVLYAKGKWGGADAWILAAIFYMLPIYQGGIMLVNYLINFFIVSLVYMAVYTIILGAKHHVFGLFIKELKKSALIVVCVPAAYLAFSFGYVFINGYTDSIYMLFWTFLFITAMMLFWVYAKVIEKDVFVRKISTQQLKKGDVLLETKWVGITEDEIAALQKTKRFVTIKDGVRFVPVFAITLVVTMLFGNLLLLFF